MAARCFDDTCSVKTTEVITGSGPAIQIDVELASDGSLRCDDGLRVNLVNEDPASIASGRECANILRKNASGYLHAVIPQAVSAGSSNSNYAAVQRTADAASPAEASLNFSYTNNSGCTQLVIMRGQFNLNYACLEEDSAVSDDADLARVTSFSTSADNPPAQQSTLQPYNAQWIARLKSQVVGPGAHPVASVVADHFSTSGVIVDVGQTRTKSEWRGFVWMEELQDGATIIFTGDIFHDGTDQTMNVSTTGTVDGQDMGFRIHNCDLMALPFGVL